MTSELARTQDANAPSLPDNGVIDGEVVASWLIARASVFGWFGVFVLALLIVGGVLALVQQSS